MTLPRSTADVLSGHVLFEIESIDRMYLNVYQPKLQYGGGVSAFFVGHRGHKYASSVLMAPITEAFVANIHHFIHARGLDLVSFGRGEDKDAIAHKYLAAFDGKEGVLFVGRAQEKARAFRTQKRRNPATGKEYLWLTRATLQVNYFYFYCVDEDFGPYADRLVMPRRPVLSWSESGSPVPARHESALACARQRVSRKARRLSGAAYRPGGVPSGASLERACSLSAMSACR
jgi:hypothetical protein